MMILFKRFKIKRLLKKIKALQHTRLHNPAKPEDIKSELGYYNELIVIYRSLIGHKKYPHALFSMLECLRQASQLEDAMSSYELGQYLLNEAIFRKRLQGEGIFASNSNEKRAIELFDEAHAYLSLAEKLSSVKAKRLRGLCYINGWGVDPDKGKGFELIVASINDENSWEKVPEIFKELGLNKPEFFQALNQHRR